MDEPFVGRAAELAELRRQFELAEAGQGRVVVLAGPAGSGKTALIRRCLPGWAGHADAVLLSGDETEVALAGGLLGQLAQPGERPAPSSPRCWPAGAPTRCRRGSALLALLRETRRRDPAVVVVDDAQWGDDLSLQALSFAARRLAADPVLCVVATRPDGPGQAAAWPGPGWPPSMACGWTLAGLAAAEVAELAELTGAGAAARPGRRAAARAHRRRPAARQGAAARPARPGAAAPRA